MRGSLDERQRGDRVSDNPAVLTTYNLCKVIF